jgi:two-component system nitrogen regulation sensor histidine kinase NtrY|tara:strand:+ start:94 stop:1554 length:1461 start_codon:yes stop_codon:yes gene_type:complete
MRLIEGKISLRTRLFLAMVILVFTACIMILVATYFQYDSESESYNQFRMERKEKQLFSQIDYLVRKNNLFPINLDDWRSYNADFESVRSILNVDYSIFDLNGNPLYTNFLPLKIIANNYKIEKRIIELIKLNPSKKHIENNIDEIGRFQSSYSYLVDSSGDPYAILFFPYFEDVSFSENELNTFLQSLYQIYLLMLVIAIGIAYFISKYVTRSLETLRLQINSTGLLKKNEKIHLSNPSREIDSLVKSYNKMIDDLEKSAEKLAKTEREQAWQEMAKQVAHEIKNPLTPMRLSIQNFQRRYEKSSNKINKVNVEEFSNSLIEQIDVMSNVATAFSDFATLPKANLKLSNIVEITRRATEIFEYENIIFKSNVDKILFPLDRTQWIRVMTNLIQNGLQSVSADRKPKIKVELKNYTKKIFILVSDNGGGVDPNLKNKIFEPMFTTKTKGMGLGLGIVKKIIEIHKGLISYKSDNKTGTTFTIELQKK